jgi:hypothetical protein
MIKFSIGVERTLICGFPISEISACCNLFGSRTTLGPPFVSSWMQSVNLVVSSRLFFFLN